MGNRGGRIIAVLLAAILLLSLTACNNRGGESQNLPAAAAPVQTVLPLK